MAVALTSLPAVCDPEQPPLDERSLLSPEEGDELARTFKLLGAGSRLRMLHALARDEELSLSDLAVKVGMSPQAVSNQLQRLVDRGILAARREGGRAYYRIVDPCLPALLELAICLTDESGS
jgi:ArsR family transcriptional regulator, lead/cadmium/zinc/bismuth-responsive transcriptional repressor